MIVGEISALDDVWSIADVPQKREEAGVLNDRREIADVLSKEDVALVGDSLALAVTVRSGRVTADILLAMNMITSTYSGWFCNQCFHGFI